MANSGKDVPTATMVKPINDSLTPSQSAKLTALSTTSLPPITKATKPRTIKIIDLTKLISLTFIASVFAPS